MHNRMAAHGKETEVSSTHRDVGIIGLFNNSKTHCGQSTPTGSGGEEAPVVEKVSAECIRDVVRGECKSIEFEQYVIEWQRTVLFVCNHAVLLDIGSVDFEEVHVLRSHDQ